MLQLYSPGGLQHLQYRQIPLPLKQTVRRHTACLSNIQIMNAQYGKKERVTVRLHSLHYIYSLVIMPSRDEREELSE